MSEIYLPVRYDPEVAHFFDAGDRMFLQLRGWERLTAPGGMNLPEAEAVKVQDTQGFR